MIVGETTRFPTIILTSNNQNHDRRFGHWGFEIPGDAVLIWRDLGIFSVLMLDR